MRVLVGYTPSGIREETKASIAQFAPHVEPVDVSGDQFNYWNAISARWTGEDDLMILEQDMILRADIIPSFEACDQDWCVYEYDAIQFKPFTHVQKVSHSLGCTKFSAALQRRFPIEQVAIRVDWHVIDVMLSSHYQYHGLSPHVHGEIETLHQYGSDELEYEMVGADKYPEFVEVSGGGNDQSDVRIRRAGPS